MHRTNCWLPKLPVACLNWKDKHYDTKPWRNCQSHQLLKVNFYLQNTISVYDLWYIFHPYNSPKIGCNLESLAKKRITKKRNVGDLMGLLRMNNTIKQMKTMSNPPQAKRRRQESVESNLWVSDVSNTDLLNVLDGPVLAEPYYVSEETKSALLSVMSNTDNLLTTNFSNMATCKCIPYQHATANKQRKVKTFYMP